MSDVLYWRDISLSVSVEIIVPGCRASWKQILLFSTILIIGVLTLLSTSLKYGIHGELLWWSSALPEYNVKENTVKTTMDILNEEKVKQDDPRLIQIIKEHFIDPPSTLPYRLKQKNIQDYSVYKISPMVDTHLDKMNGGFFVECGAFDGETSSNSLFFEKTRKWNGLLIEADPAHYRTLKSKNRKAYLTNVGLSTVPYPTKMLFSQDDTNNLQKGRLADTPSQKKWIARKRKQAIEIHIQCFPLYSLLLALNQTKVDFLSLDIEGDELSVLKTIPFEKVDITMISVEYFHHADKGNETISFLKSKGYELVKRFHLDFLFKKTN